MEIAITICVVIIVSLLSTFLVKEKKLPAFQLSETNGVFRNNKASGIICIISGILLMGLFIFISFKDSEATLTGLLFGVSFGSLSMLFGLGFLLHNFKAYLYVGDMRIKGKYHWFGKIDCKLSDVTFALGRNKTLIIRLKDGKTHTIMGIENAWNLASKIRKEMLFNTTEHPDQLIERLNKLKASRKKNILFVCIGVALMFANIFITVFLTGGKEISDFNNENWIVFAIMSVIEVAIYIATFFFANKSGKSDTTVLKLQYDVMRTIVETSPALPGNAIKVYTDENYSARLTLFGFPNDDSVYYSIEAFTSDYTFVKAYDSEVFENIEHIEKDWESLIDITEKILH